jgi:hypothetical protein
VREREKKDKGERGKKRKRKRITVMTTIIGKNGIPNDSKSIYLLCHSGLWSRAQSNKTLFPESYTSVVKSWSVCSQQADN